MELQLSGDVNHTLDQIDIAFQEGNGYEIIHTILLVKKMAGIALAKALWLGNKHWNNPTEEFRDYAVRDYGIRSETIKRYIDVWDTILLAPETLREFLVKKPMQELIPVSTNIANGELSPEDIDWEKYMLTTGYGEVSTMVRGLTGQESPDRIRIYIDMSTGDIHSWRGDQREYVGFLDVRRLDNEQVKKSVYRIINKSKLKEANNA